MSLKSILKKCMYPSKVLYISLLNSLNLHFSIAFSAYFTHRFYIRTGCFRFKPEDGLCSREVCQSSSPYKILGTHKRAKFCCCFGDLCNNNISDVNTSVSSAEDTVTPGCYILNCYTVMS